MIKLGKKLNNPYSVVNMELALELLRDSLRQQNNTGVSLDAANAVEIYTTNLYVRLCATDDQSNLQLIGDSTLSLFNTPRDYSVAEPGNYYIDTIGVVNPKYQWWYATVEPDFQPANGIHCEVLDELFIPSHSRYSDANGDGIMSRDLEQSLLIASFNLTNNQDQLRTVKQGGADTRLNEGNQRSFMGTPITNAVTRVNYTPRGRVTVEVMINGQITQIPVGNVRVRIARWFEDDVFYTNNNGYYTSNKSWDEFWGGFEYNVFMTGELNGCRYTMIDVFELVYVIPNERIEGISIVFDRSSKFCGPAMIHAATTEYFTKCVQRTGIHPINQRIDIQVNSPKIGGGSATFLGVPGEIMVEYNIDKKYYDYNVSTTWHELSHASFYHNMVTHRGEAFARNFWNTVYFREMQNGPNIPYGKKGDMDWENIALAEG